jgi:hypothetical protein
MLDDPRKTLVDLARSDPLMMEIFAAVRSLALPDGWIAAGFVRNRVWDHLHGFSEPTAPNDIDVIYFEPQALDETVEKCFETILNERLPGQPWSVKNQARMARVNGDRPYRSTEHALEHWCETPTAVGIRLGAAGDLQIIAPFGLGDLFGMIVRPTPFAASHPLKLARYRERMAKKNWPRLWPRISVQGL